jgi:hypothetical protein
MILIFCDNISLVKLINKRRRTRITVNQHCYADIDLELQISHKIKTVTSADYIVSIHHVHSHKKKAIDNSTLPAEIQMNQLANQWYKHARTCRDQTHYYNFPANKANLVLNDQTLNANISKATTKAYHSMDFRTFLRYRHD